MVPDSDEDIAGSRKTNRRSSKAVHRTVGQAFLRINRCVGWWLALAVRAVTIERREETKVFVAVVSKVVSLCAKIQAVKILEVTPL